MRNSFEVRIALGVDVTLNEVISWLKFALVDHFCGSSMNMATFKYWVLGIREIFWVMSHVVVRLLNIVWGEFEPLKMWRSS